MKLIDTSSAATLRCEGKMPSHLLRGSKLAFLSAQVTKARDKRILYIKGARSRRTSSSAAWTSRLA